MRGRSSIILIFSALISMEIHALSITGPAGTLCSSVDSFEIDKQSISVVGDCSGGQATSTPVVLSQQPIDLGTTSEGGSPASATYEAIARIPYEISVPPGQELYGGTVTVVGGTLNYTPPGAGTLGVNDSDPTIISFSFTITETATSNSQQVNAQVALGKTVLVPGDCTPSTSVLCKGDIGWGTGLSKVNIATGLTHAWEINSYDGTQREISWSEGDFKYVAISPDAGDYEGNYWPDGSTDKESCTAISAAGYLSLKSDSCSLDVGKTYFFNIRTTGALDSKYHLTR